VIIDERTEFADATALNTGAAGTYNIGDIYDTGMTTSDVGLGEPLWLVVQVTTGITVASSTGTVQVKLVSDATTTIATDGSATQHVAGAAVATSTTAIAAGTVLLAVCLPSGTYERYLAIQQVTATTALNAGAINAFLTHDYAKWVVYADAVA
jgi:hypothetical protein